jgi:hypothetical protein
MQASNPHPKKKQRVSSSSTTRTLFSYSFQPPSSRSSNQRPAPPKVVPTSFDASSFDVTTRILDHVLKIPLLAEGAAKQLGLAAARKTRELLEANNCIIDPSSDFEQALFDSQGDHPGVTRGVVYKKLNGRKKVGSTFNSVERNDNYQKEEGEPPMLLCLINIDDGCIDADMDNKLQALVDNLANQIIAHPHVPVPQKMLWKTLRQRGADIYGPRRVILLQLVESSFQTGSNLVSEFLMFNAHCYNTREEIIDKSIEEFFCVVSVADCTEDWAMMSWNTGYTGHSNKPRLSSTVIYTEAILVATDNKQNVLLFADYLKEELVEAEVTANHFIRNGVNKKQLMILDINNLVFPNDGLVGLEH